MSEFAIQNTHRLGFSFFLWRNSCGRGFQAETRDLCIDEVQACRKDGILAAEDDPSANALRGKGKGRVGGWSRGNKNELCGRFFVVLDIFILDAVQHNTTRGVELTRGESLCLLFVHTLAPLLVPISCGSAGLLSHPSFRRVSFLSSLVLSCSCGRPQGLPAPRPRRRRAEQGFRHQGAPGDHDQHPQAGGHRNHPPRAPAARGTQGEHEKTGTIFFSVGKGALCTVVGLCCKFVVAFAGVPPLGTLGISWHHAFRIKRRMRDLRLLNYPARPLSCLVFWLSGGAMLPLLPLPFLLLRPLESVSPRSF